LKLKQAPSLRSQEGTIIMSPRKSATYQAVVYDDDDNSKSVPLLADERRAVPQGSDDRDHDQELAQLLDGPVFGKFKLSSLILGLLVGFFIQFSTLGANFLVITIWGDDVISKSKRDIVVFSLLWSFFTSAMAIVILGFLRTLVGITFSVFGRNGKKQRPSQNRKDDDLLEDMVLHMECRFVVGALVGVCMAWTITDLLLGMKAQILYSVITLCVALCWCRIMMSCFTASEVENHADDDEVEEEEEKQDLKRVSGLLIV